MALEVEGLEIAVFYPLKVGAESCVGYVQTPLPRLLVWFLRQCHHIVYAGFELKLL